MLGCFVGLSILAGSNHPIENQLKAAKLAYSDLGSFWSVTFKLDAGKRKHDVYIRKTQEEYRSLKVHEVSGVIWESTKPPTSEFFQKVFSKRLTPGGLVYELPTPEFKKYQIRYRQTIFQDHSQERLVQLLSVVALSADMLEKELNPNAGDKF
jgi:hypothetical protein